LVIEYNKIDDRFLLHLRFPLLPEGNFSPDYPSDSLKSVIVNESISKGGRLEIE
jgi:hypothetical protein